MQDATRFNIDPKWATFYGGASWVVDSADQSRPSSEWLKMLKDTRNELKSVQTKLKATVDELKDARAEIERLSVP